MGIVLLLLTLILFVAPAAFILGYYVGKRVQANKQRVGFPVRSTSAAGELHPSIETRQPNHKQPTTNDMQ